MAYTTPRTWVTGETVTAALMNTHVRDNLNAIIPGDADVTEVWSPTLEGTTADDTGGSVTGRKWRIGPMQHVWFRFVYGGDGSGPTGTFFVTLPVASSGITANASLGQVIGSWAGFDASAAGNSEAGVVFLSALSEVRFRRPIGANVTDTTPFIWTTGDILSFEACYPVA